MTLFCSGVKTRPSVSQVSAQLSLSQTSACSPLCRWRRRNRLYPEDDEPCVSPLWWIQLYFYHTSLVKLTAHPMNQFTWADRALEMELTSQQTTHTYLIHQYSELSLPSGCTPCFSSSLTSFRDLHPAVSVTPLTLVQVRRTALNNALVFDTKVETDAVLEQFPINS